MLKRSLAGAKASFQPVYLGVSSILLLAACVDRQQNIYDASAQGGDYAVLSCAELAVAERSIGQRLSGSANYAPGEGANQLGSQGEQLANARRYRSCPETAVVVPVEVAEGADNGAALESPAYLQVATFQVDVNRDDTISRLRAQGFAVASRPITLAGEVHHRVIIGPLTTVGDVAAADQVAIALGFDDAFFVKG